MSCGSSQFSCLGSLLDLSVLKNTNGYNTTQPTSLCWPLSTDSTREVSAVNIVLSKNTLGMLGPKNIFVFEAMELYLTCSRNSGVSFSWNKTAQINSHSMEARCWGFYRCLHGPSGYRVLKCDMTNIWIFEIIGFILKDVQKEHDEKLPTCQKSALYCNLGMRHQLCYAPRTPYNVTSPL